MTPEPVTHRGKAFVPSRYTSTSWATPERVILLVRMRSKCRQWRTILAALRKLPGADMDERDLRAYCRRHRVQAGQAYGKAAARMRQAKADKRARIDAAVILEIIPAPPYRADLDAEITDDGQDYVVVSLSDALVWCTEHALAFRGWDDLPAVNEVRERRGLLRFARLFGRRD